MNRDDRDNRDQLRAASRSRPVVVVDTTAFYGVWGLKGRRWPEMLEHCREDALQLIVPEIVLRETVRHQKEDSLKADSSIRGLAVALRLAGLPDQAFGHEALSQQIKSFQSDYESWFRSHLSDCRVRVWPHPDISHGRLVDWIMEYRLPIGGDGKGYRDALIWATVLEVAERASVDQTVYFVTANTKDFCRGDDLESTLKKDIEHLPNKPCVYWSKDFEDLHHRISEYLRIARGKQSTRGRHPTELDLVTEAVLGSSDRLLGWDLSQEVWGTAPRLEVGILPDEFQPSTIEALEFDRDSLVWNPHEEFEGGTVVGMATVRGDVEIDGFMCESDWYIAEDQDIDIRIIDRAWNEHMFHVAVSLTLELEFRVNVNPEIGSVDEVELVSVHEPSLFPCT